ncbi:MAG: hypothetical protein HY707_10370 [Ignavibacteriae bacterium]|nr:hypothetical protein [Ignavibacteriota bacterium]
MVLLTAFHPTNAADLLEIYGLLVAILLVAMLLNELYEWLKKKPWRKQPNEQIIDLTSLPPHSTTLLT